MYSYTLTIDDYLNLFLFNLSRDKGKKKANRNTHIKLTILLLIVGLFLVFKTEEPISGFFGILVTLSTIYFFFNGPYATKKKQREDFILYIHDTYKTTLNQPRYIWIEPTMLHIQDDGGEYNYKLEKIVSVIEIREDLFMKCHSGDFIVIPKTMEDFDKFKEEVRTQLADRQIWEIDIDWKW